MHALRLQQHPLKASDQKEVRNLLGTAHHHKRDFTLREMLIGTIFRLGELLGLCIGDAEISERSGMLTKCQTKRGRYR